MIQLSNVVKRSIRRKLNGTSKLPDTHTVLEGRDKPYTLLKFDRDHGSLYVSVSRRKIMRKKGRKVKTSKFLGRFKASELLSNKKR